MNLKRIKENKVLRIIANKYVVILVVFVVWMSFF